MVTLFVPTIFDDMKGFTRLFTLWYQIAPKNIKEVKVDFTFCEFLAHNGVAFLGGLARVIENRNGQIYFEWDTLNKDIRTNLEQNGFAGTFGYSKGPWHGNSIPYKEDFIEDTNSYINYLRDQWLGRGWVNISSNLSEKIIGKVCESYLNAFEHGHSYIGVMSCGQHYPTLGQLKLTLLDFGIGIPNSVRSYFKDPNMRADLALKWAFQRGNSTKQEEGVIRGLGLDILRDFVRLNKGSLEIFSHEGYVMIDEHKEFFAIMENFFEGTLVNITLQCDEHFYDIALNNTNALFSI